MFEHLFSPFALTERLELRNRLTMTALGLGYAGEAGTVSPVMLEHYRLMARSGVALVVVEKASVDHPVASGSTRDLRVDTDECMDGLIQLARAIKGEGALASIQLNHAGRYAEATPLPVALLAVCSRWPREKLQAWKEKL